MEIADLTNEQLKIIAAKNPEWVANNLPKWLFNDQPQLIARLRPDWMMVNRPVWMADNRSNWVIAYRPDLMDHCELAFNAPVPNEIMELLK